MTWEQESRATATNALIHNWDPMTWLSRVDRSNVVALGYQTEDKNGSNLSACSRGLPQLFQGEYIGAPQLGSTLHFPYKQGNRIESSGKNPEVLNNAYLLFLVNLIRKGTIGTYKSGWCQLKTFCEGFGIYPQWAQASLILKSIRHLFASNLF